MFVLFWCAQHCEYALGRGWSVQLGACQQQEQLEKLSVQSMRSEQDLSGSQTSLQSSPFLARTEYRCLQQVQQGMLYKMMELRFRIILDHIIKHSIYCLCQA